MNIVELAFVIREAMKEHLASNPDATHESTERAALLAGMKFSSSKVNPELIARLANLERSVYDNFEDISLQS